MMDIEWRGILITEGYTDPDIIEAEAERLWFDSVSLYQTTFSAQYDGNDVTITRQKK